MSETGQLEDCLRDARTASEESFLERWGGYYLLGEWPAVANQGWETEVSTAVVSIDNLRSQHADQKRASSIPAAATATCCCSSRPGPLP